MVCGCNNKDIVLKFLQLKKAAVSMFDHLLSSCRQSLSCCAMYVEFVLCGLSVFLFCMSTV